MTDFILRLRRLLSRRGAKRKLARSSLPGLQQTIRDRADQLCAYVVETGSVPPEAQLASLQALAELAEVRAKMEPAIHQRRLLVVGLFLASVVIAVTLSTARITSTFVELELLTDSLEFRTTELAPMLLNGHVASLTVEGQSRSKPSAAASGVFLPPVTVVAESSVAGSLRDDGRYVDVPDLVLVPTGLSAGSEIALSAMAQLTGEYDSQPDLVSVHGDVGYFGTIGIDTTYVMRSGIQVSYPVTEIDTDSTSANADYSVLPPFPPWHLSISAA